MRIIDFSTDKLLALNSGFRWFSRDQLELLGSVRSVFSLIDRTGTLDVGIKTKILQPIPTGVTSKSFEEICDDRARQIVAAGRPIAVYWSGGIDSTLALIALLKVGACPTVVYTRRSIQEYPAFFDRFVRDRLPTRQVRPTIFSDVDPTEVMVTGEFGDQLMGSVNIEKFVEQDGSIGLAHEMPWRDMAMSHYSARYVELVEPLVAKAPLPIISAFDFLWWMNIACKWQHVQLRLGNNLEGRMGEYLANVQHFYQSDDFQRWSFDEENHRRLKLGGTFASYKHHMKSVIGDFTGDADYEQNKLKYGSLPTATANHFAFRLDDGTAIRFGANSDDPDAFARAYGDRFASLFGAQNGNY